jgi:TolA-binding protein
MNRTRISVIIFVCAAIAAVGTLSAAALLERSEPAERLEAARAMIGPAWPLGPERRASTDGGIYLGNLNGQIQALQARVTQRPDDASVARLALLLYHRFQIEGRLSDAEESRELIGEAAAGQHAAGIDLAQARILLAFHDFEETADAIDAAEQNGASAAEVLDLRRTLARARGLSVPETSEAQTMTVTSPSELVMLASEMRNQERPDQASRLLKAAQDIYADSAPYVLAWIHVQQGIVFLDQEDYRSANLFFKAAYRRFPQYTLAAEHLAETELALGNAARAAELYRLVIERSGHPEFMHQLAAAERGLGNVETALALAEQAEAAYRELVERYPLMYADHATLYYIDIGARDKAVELATLNLAQRQSPQAEELLATARECCR